MGGAASARRPERRGPPRTLVSKLDGETRAFDLMKLMDQDTVDAAREAKRRAVLDQLDSAQAAAMVELTTRHVAEVDELVERHKARVEALYESTPGLITPTEMLMASPARHAHARAQKLLWRPSSDGHTPPPPSAIRGQLPQSNQQLRLGELGMMIASLPPGRAMQSGLRTLSALDAVHQTELDELEATQQREVAAAQLHAQYERTAALYKIDYPAGEAGEGGDDNEDGGEEQEGADAEDNELAQLLDGIEREGTAISEVDQEGRPFSEMSRAWAEIENAKPGAWRRSASPPSSRRLRRTPCHPRCCSGSRSAGPASGDDDAAEVNEVEALVVRSLAIEAVRPDLEPALPDDVEWKDVEEFLMAESQQPEADAVRADPAEYSKSLCVRMLDKQLALTDG